MSRLQERAREARYRLLVDRAKAIGADALLTAHHADDQAETVLFRLLRGSGVAGLRGMELTTARDGVTIARPLIGLKKRDLIAFAQARGAAFVDDPSNADPRFARTRLRALLVRLGEEGLDAEALDRLARRAGETEQALAHMTAKVEAGLGSEGPIDGRALYAAPIAIVQRILARRIAAAGGRDPSRIGLEKIEALAIGLREALRERRAFGANVGGALVRLTAKGRLSFRPRAAEEGRQAIGTAELAAIRLGFLGRRPIRAEDPAQAGWIVLDFLGFSRPNRDFSRDWRGVDAGTISFWSVPRGSADAGARAVLA